MSTYPPPLSPTLRRRQSFNQHSPLSFQDQSLHSPNHQSLSPSIYVTTPRGSQFINVPIIAREREEGGEERRNILRVPLTPSRAVIDQMSRFGPGAQEGMLGETRTPEETERGQEKKKNEMSWKEKVRSWMIYQGPQWIWVGVWFVIQSLVFGFGVVNYMLKDNLVAARSTFGSTFILARSAALVLHVDIAFILLPICRGFVSRLRRSTLNELVPFEKNMEFHKLVAWSIVFWTLVHTIAHLVNFWRLAIVLSSTTPGRILAYFKANFATGPGVTGWTMLVLLGVMLYFALEGKRKKHFERFYYSHHLFVPFFACWQFHGMFCMIKPDRPPFCSYQNIATFWKYILLSLTLYLFERLLREYRSRQRTWITAVIQHPSEVIELQFKKEKTRISAGQYIMLNCPEISYFQWHPFSITSAPEEDFISVHIRVVGDFTRSFAETLGCKVLKKGEQLNADEGAQIVPLSFSRVLPRIMVDGPFGSASEDVFNYEVSILVAGGIGVTPFASVLKHIWYRLNASKSDSTRLSKVYFFWICRDFTSFKWFQTLLLALEAQDTSGHIEIHTYLTSSIKINDLHNIITQSVSSPTDAITRLRAPTHYGRPNFSNLFPRIANAHAGTREIGVFFCGPKPMARNLETICKKSSSSSEEGTRFVWRKENF
ncbi:hypothetical protein JCM5353_006754 [Sporobolomyces roseus]